MPYKYDLDAKDYRIIDALQENCWSSSKEIAAAVGLSISATAQRIRALRETENLLSAHAVVDPASMGVQLEALFLIQLDKHDQSTVEEFMNEVLNLPEVVSIFLVTGRYDIVANVVGTSMDHLKALAFEQFTSRPFITRIETSIVYNSLHARVLKPLEKVG